MRSEKHKWDTVRGQLAKKLAVVTPRSAAACYETLQVLDDEELTQFLQSSTPQDALGLAWLKRFAPVALRAEGRTA